MQLIRNRIVSVRLTEVEYERLRQRAGKAARSVSEQVRAEMFREPSLIEWIPGYGGGSITFPNPANVIWLTDGRADGNTLTVAA